MADVPVVPVHLWDREDRAAADAAKRGSLSRTAVMRITNRNAAVLRRLGAH